MTKNLTSVIKQLNELIKDTEVGIDTINVICNELKNYVNASVVVVDIKGKKIVTEFYGDTQTIFSVNDINDHKGVDNQLNDQLKNVVESRVNISLSNFYFKHVTKAELNKYSAAILPLSASKERLGTLLIYKEKNKFVEDEISLIEISTMLISLVLKHSKKEEDAEEARRVNIVKSAISTLSYSELEAILHIFEELDGKEGLLVASKIADRVGITRSVIVNALRKFESAGVIESRSLGMKGTYLKVLNDLLIVELNKMRN